MKNAKPEIVCLRQDIENDIRRKIKTPADFDFLVGVVWERLHEPISTSTLKRIWGYIEGTDQTRRTTLSLLSRFLGYDDWDHYVQHISEISEEDSDMFDGEGIRAEQLNKGDRVEVAWLPNRRCLFQYLGNMRFAVVENENSKLRAGDTFDAACFLLGQPMYLDNLVRDSNPPTSYVAGAKSGLTSVKIIEAQDS